MIHIGTIEIETKRVLLRRFRLEDSINMLTNWANDDLVTRYLSWNSYSDIKQVKDYIKKLNSLYEDKSFYYWAIELKEIGEVIGSISADINERLSCAHLSFCIGQDWWNKRIMQEVITNLIPIFMEKIQVERLESCHESGNNTAGKVLIRSGFQSEAIMRNSYFGINGSTNMNWYAIIKDNYFLKKKLSNISLEQLYIINYKESGGEHFKSITRLSKEDAFLLAKKLSSHTNSRNDRYGEYFKRYYEKRMNTEEVLYKQFVKNGGQPQTYHPIYFVLCENQGMSNFYGNSDFRKISLSEIPSEFISFTPRDSMHLMDMGLLNGNIWRKQTLFDMLTNSNNGIGNQIVDIPGMYGNAGGYIEVQVWDDTCIKNCLMS